MVQIKAGKPHKKRHYYSYTISGAHLPDDGYVDFVKTRGAEDLHRMVRDKELSGVTFYDEATFDNSAQALEYAKNESNKDERKLFIIRVQRIYESGWRGPTKSESVTFSIILGGKEIFHEDDNFEIQRQDTILLLECIDRAEYWRLNEMEKLLSETKGGRRKKEFEEGKKKIDEEYEKLKKRCEIDLISRG